MDKKHTVSKEFLEGLKNGLKQSENQYSFGNLNTANGNLEVNSIDNIINLIKNPGNEFTEATKQRISQEVQNYLFINYGTSGLNNRIVSALAKKTDKLINLIVQYIHDVKNKGIDLRKENQQVTQDTYYELMTKLDAADHAIGEVYEYARRMIIDKFSSHALTREDELNRSDAHANYKMYIDELLHARDCARELLSKLSQINTNKYNFNNSALKGNNKTNDDGFTI